MDNRAISSPTGSLRARLRSDTRAQHEALDAAMARLDLSKPAGLGDFLAVQHAAMSGLACDEGAGSSAPDRAEVSAVSAEMLAALADDLAALDRPLPGPAARLSADPTAVLYILLGSRLGTQVMARHWAASAEGAARAAGRYLTLDPRREAWRAFVQRSGDAPGTGPDADRLVADARAIFGHYAATLAALSAGPDPGGEGGHA